MAVTATASERVLTGRVRPWLGWFALSVIIGMEAGTVFRPLGSTGDTRVADWVDCTWQPAPWATSPTRVQRAGLDLRTTGPPAAPLRAHPTAGHDSRRRTARW